MASKTVGAHLMAVYLHRLPVDAHMLTVDLARLRLLANLLTLDLACLDLLAAVLTLDPRLLDAINARLLALHSSRTLGAHLLALHSSRTLVAHLHALCPLRPFERRYPLRPLHARRSHLLDTFGTRRCTHLNPLSASRLTVNALLGLRLSATSPILVWPRGGRGGDRQCGDARGEKYPGHHKFSF